MEKSCKVTLILNLMVIVVEVFEYRETLNS